MAIVKVVELIGTSNKSWDDALTNLVEEASHSIRNIKGVDVVHQTVHVENGRITEYRLTGNVAFVVERGGNATA